MSSDAQIQLWPGKKKNEPRVSNVCVWMSDLCWSALDMHTVWCGYVSSSCSFL